MPLHVVTNTIVILVSYVNVLCDLNFSFQAFGFFTLGCIGANTYFSFKAWRGESSHQSSPDKGSSQAGEYNAERNMEQY